MAWTDDLLAADIYVNGVRITPRSSKLDFLGNLTASYNSTTQRLELRLSASTWKQEVRVATAAALPAYTRAGNLYTANANGALPNVDGKALALNEDLLLKNGAAGEDNGPLTILDLGSGSTPWIAQRRVDFDEDADIAHGAVIPVRTGTANAGKLFALTTDGVLVLNTTALTFTAV